MVRLVLFLVSGSFWKPAFNANVVFRLDDKRMEESYYKEGGEPQKEVQ